MKILKADSPLNKYFSGLINCHFVMEIPKPKDAKYSELDARFPTYFEKCLPNFREMQGFYERAEILDLKEQKFEIFFRIFLLNRFLQQECKTLDPELPLSEKILIILENTSHQGTNNLLFWKIHR